MAHFLLGHISYKRHCNLISNCFDDFKEENLGKICEKKPQLTTEQLLCSFKPFQKYFTAEHVFINIS